MQAPMLDCLAKHGDRTILATDIGEGRHAGTLARRRSDCASEVAACRPHDDRTALIAKAVVRSAGRARGRSIRSSLARFGPVRRRRRSAADALV
jgi:hypothetical protein